MSPTVAFLVVVAVLGLLVNVISARILVGGSQNSLNMKSAYLEVMGDLLTDDFYDDLAADQQQAATMSMLVPPQMINTMVGGRPWVDEVPPAGREFTDAFLADPVRRYMIPVLSDRRTDWPSHPFASRDSLHEHDMWVAEGLTHRYPTKVLAELLPTCPQYCGHCTRMDLVGNSTAQVTKLKLAGKPVDGKKVVEALGRSADR